MVRRLAEIVAVLVGLGLVGHGAWLLSPIAAEIFVGLLFIGAGTPTREVKG